MGQDKALLEIDGSPLAVTVAAALRGAGASVVVAVGGDRESLVALGAFDEVIQDRYPGEGPLGGIIDTLQAAGSDPCVILACDTPTITAFTPRRLLEELERSDADIALALVEDRRQPLTAAWRSDTCLPALEVAFAAGERAPRRALDSLRVVEVTDIPADAVVDLDRPSDLARYAASRPKPSSGAE